MSLRRWCGQLPGAEAGRCQIELKPQNIGRRAPARFLYYYVIGPIFDVRHCRKYGIGFSLLFGRASAHITLQVDDGRNATISFAATQGLICISRRAKGAASIARHLLHRRLFSRRFQELAARTRPRRRAPIMPNFTFMTSKQHALILFKCRHHGITRQPRRLSAP